MRFGVNYTPRDGWFHSWLDFDRAKVRDDFATIREIGADHVRIFPLWPLLQPNRSLIRPSAIADVVATVEEATHAGLDVSVDVLQGHLSSFDFLPSWVSTWHRRNLFTDPDVVEAERTLVRELATALRGINGVTGLTLGNEFVQFAATRHPDFDEITKSQADRWLDELLGEARTCWPDGTHVHSHDDDVWFEDSQPFTPLSAATKGDLTTVHSWVFGRVGPRFGRGAECLPWFARYLCELAYAWSPDPNRRVWLQEIGAPETYVDIDKAPQFLTDTIDILMGQRGGGVTPGLSGITWWCSHDVSRELVDFPALEHTLGLIDSHGEPKPIGRAFTDSVRQWANTRYAPIDRPAIQVGQSPWTRSHTSAEHAVFDQWIEHALAGDVRAIELDTTTYITDGRTNESHPRGSYLATRD
ncbi:MAG: hypothetical protein Q4P71_08160 [Actinomycetaceae bacterium]|nr:hypothetical protein [Actinomycetaceae bacterium]